MTPNHSDGKGDSELDNPHFSGRHVATIDLLGVTTSPAGTLRLGTTGCDSRGRTQSVHAVRVRHAVPLPRRQRERKALELEQQRPRLVRPPRAHPLHPPRLDRADGGFGRDNRSVWWFVVDHYLHGGPGHEPLHARRRPPQLRGRPQAGQRRPSRWPLLPILSAKP